MNECINYWFRIKKEKKKQIKDVTIDKKLDMYNGNTKGNKVIITTMLYFTC